MSGKRWVKLPKQEKWEVKEFRMKNLELRVKRYKKIRKKIFGSGTRPRLSIFKSNKHIYAQIIDDNLGKTLVSSHDERNLGTKKDKAYNIGKKLAQKANKLKITTVVFDRGGFLYHGRVREVAKGAREGGLKF